MPASALTTLGIVGICSAVVYAIRATYNHRSRIARLREKGLTLAPEWSWAFGHLLMLGKVTQKCPADVNVSKALLGIFDDHGGFEYKAFLIDLWPMSNPIIMISSPEAATQATATQNFPKSSMVVSGMVRMTGGPDLLTMHGPEWKYWRSVFNPGFSAQSMSAQIGIVVDRVEELCHILTERAGGEPFPLSTLTSRMTADIIVKITLDLDINYLRSSHPLMDAYRIILAWNSFWDPRILLNPVRLIMQGYYGHVMNKIIKKRLNELFLEMQQETDGTGEDNTKPEKKRTSVAGLALKAYSAQKPEGHRTTSKNLQLDPVFADYATWQTRLFLLAGNDTTSTTIIYIFHLLHGHPEKMALVQEEHNSVFGSDVNLAGARIREDPTILNRCPYTLAVIKEVLRLYPPAGTTRLGPVGATISDESGNVIPVDDCDVFPNQFAIHTNPRFWPRANEFLPERWLVSQGHELYTDDNAAFRPFEHGPRNCIGQTLVMNEIRIVLALTARRFRIRPAYEEWDAKKASDEGWMDRLARSLGLKNEMKTFKGERAYQTDATAAGPSDGYPCRVEVIG